MYVLPPECVLKHILPVFPPQEPVRIHPNVAHKVSCMISTHQVHTDIDFTARTKPTEGEQPSNECYGMDVASFLVRAEPRITGPHTVAGRGPQFQLKWD